MAITGGCLCGAVRFEINADAPLWVRQCWCRVCQYLGAGSGTVNAIFPKEAVSVSGPLAEFVNVADSGSVMHRRFCSRCGTPVFTEAEPRPHQTAVRVGTLDDPNLAKPTALIGRSRPRSGPASIRTCRRRRGRRLHRDREAGSATMLFMVIERFRDNDMIPVYQRLLDTGRTLPEGLEYVDSWVEANFSRCFQLMRCDDPRLFQQWALEWRGLGMNS